MISVNLIYIGDIREKYLLDAVAEYEKRLGAYCRLSDFELKEEKLPENPSPAQISAAIEKEGVRILDALPKKSLKIALCIEGAQYSSEEFSILLQKAASDGFSQISFVIGGAFGLSDEVKKLCDIKLSVSKMTFTHRMARVLLLEQIYRAENIAAGGKYHK